MTSAPVKDVGSLMNYINRAPVTSGIGAENASGFGDVMSKASSDRQGLKGSERMTSKEVSKETKVDKSHTRPEAKKVENNKNTRRMEETDEAAQKAVEDAGKEMVKKVADELGVSEEEVTDAMEALGLGMAALMDAGSLTQLVLAISGGDSLTLLTDAGLYDSLQLLLSQQEELLAGIQMEFSLNTEEMQQLLKEMNQTEEMPEQMTADETKESDISEDMQEAPKITVTVEEGTRSVTLTTDENGNVEQAKAVVSKEAEGGKHEEKSDEHSHSKGSEEGVMAGNPLLDAAASNKALHAELSFEQTQAYMTPDTEKLMNQIMDYMKLQLKPGMEQLEMQLSPASLGTLRIQLSSNGGEVTAQFHVQNEAVKAAIESQMAELKESLREQGVTVEAVEVMVESHAFERNLWQGQERNDGSAYENKKSPRRIDLSRLEEDFEEEASEEEILAAKMMEANGNTVDYTA